LVHVLNSRDDLLIELASLSLVEFDVLHDVVEELTARGVLHDEVELLRSLYDLVQLDDVRMADQLQDVDLSRHSLNVRDICDSFLLKDFNGYLFAGERMSTKFDLAEGALADGLLEQVVPDHSAAQAELLLGQVVLDGPCLRLDHHLVVANRSHVVRVTLRLLTVPGSQLKWLRCLSWLTILRNANCHYILNK